MFPCFHVSVAAMLGRLHVVFCAANIQFSFYFSAKYAAQKRFSYKGEYVSYFFPSFFLHISAKHPIFATE